MILLLLGTALVLYLCIIHLPIAFCPCGLGNALCYYCVMVVRAGSSGQPFWLWCPQDFGSRMFAHLPRRLENLPRPSVQPPFSLLMSPIEVWNHACPELHAYAQHLHTIVAPHVKTTPPDAVVIHYRMSDSPFNRHPDYPLMRYSYFARCLRDHPRHTKIVVLSCPKRYSWESASPQTRAVQAYAADFAEWLTDAGYDVEVTSGSLDGDFARMFHAGTLISSGSSLSYMAGLLSKNKTFVPNVKNLDFTTRPDFTLVQADYVPHCEVDDYFDVKRVCEKLRRM